jgi:hypothetical protein
MTLSLAFTLSLNHAFGFSYMSLLSIGTHSLLLSFQLFLHSLAYMFIDLSLGFLHHHHGTFAYRIPSYDLINYMTFIAFMQSCFCISSICIYTRH